MSAEARRFSVTAYAAGLQQGGEAGRIPFADSAAADRDELAPLRALTEEVRLMLAAPRGWSEEERRKYAEKLNRAVIGFPQERAEMLAVISDWIIKNGSSTWESAVFHMERWRKLYSRKSSG